MGLAHSIYFQAFPAVVQIIFIWFLPEVSISIPYLAHQVSPV